MRASTFASLLALAGCASWPVPPPPDVPASVAARPPKTPAADAGPRQLVRVHLGRVELSPMRRNGVEGIAARINPVVDPPVPLFFALILEQGGRPLASTNQRYRRPSGQAGTEAIWAPRAGVRELFIPYAALDLPIGHTTLTATVTARARPRDNFDIRVAGGPPPSVEVDFPPLVDIRFIVKRLALVKRGGYDGSLSGGSNPPDPTWVVFHDGQPVCSGQPVSNSYEATWRGHCRPFRMSESDEIVLEARDSDTIVDDTLARFTLGLTQMTARTQSREPLRGGPVRHLEIDVIWAPTR